MTVYDDNPAGRLHKLLTSYSRNASQHKAGVTWAATLGMPEDAPDLFARLARVYRLPSDIDAEIARLDSHAEYDPDMALRWQNPIRSAFGISLFSDQTSGQLVSYFNEPTLISLENCSYVLHRYRPQPAIADSEVERIRQLISELEEEVTSGAGLEPELRTFLLYHAHLMARALSDFDISGNAALEEAYDQAIGAVIRRKDLLVHGKENEKKKSAWEKWFTILTSVAAVLQIATSALMLPGQIRDAIEGPSAQPPAIVKVIQQPSPSTGSTHESPAAASSATTEGARPSHGAAHRDHQRKRVFVKRFVV